MVWLTFDILRSELGRVVTDFTREVEHGEVASGVRAAAARPVDEKGAVRVRRAYLNVVWRLPIVL